MSTWSPCTKGRRPQPAGQTEGRQVRVGFRTCGSVLCPGVPLRHRLGPSAWLWSQVQSPPPFSSAGPGSKLCSSLDLSCAAAHSRDPDLGSQLPVWTSAHGPCPAVPDFLWDSSSLEGICSHPDHRVSLRYWPCGQHKGPSGQFASMRPTGLSHPGSLSPAQPGMITLGTFSQGLLISNLWAGLSLHGHPNRALGRKQEQKCGVCLGQAGSPGS